MNVFPKIDRLPPYTLGKVGLRIQELMLQGHDVIDLSQLNPSMPPSQYALDRLVQASLNPNNHRYSASSGINALRSTFLDYYRWKFGANIDSLDNVVVTSGTKEGVVHLLMSILQSGDSMLVPVPAYPVHSAAAALMGVSFIGVPLWRSFDNLKEAGGKLTSGHDYFFERLERRYIQTWPRPRLILTSFPHNPTTTIVTPCFYERLLDFAKVNNCFVINDFAHGDLFYNKSEVTSLMSIPGASDYGIELYSLSKGFSLSGWRVGCAVGQKNALDALRSLKSYVDFGIFQPLQIASSQFLKHEIETNGDYSNEVISFYQENRDIVVNSLEKIGFSVHKSKATPLVWAKMPKSSQFNDSIDLCEDILETKKVAFFPGSAFDQTQAKCIRVSLTKEESRLRTAMMRLSCVLCLILFIAVESKAENDCPKALGLVKKSHFSVFSKEDVKSSLDEAIKICPELVEAYYEYGRFYIRAGEYEKAEAKFREAENLKKRVEHVLGIALSQSLRKDYVSSENTYKEALTMYLGHWSLLEGLAVLYMELDKLPEAEELLRQALQSETMTSSIYYNLGLVLERQGKFSEAKVSFKTALQKDESLAAPAISLIRILLKEGREMEAIKIGQNIRLRVKNDDDLNFALADSLLAYGSFEEVRELLVDIKSESSELRKKVFLAILDLYEGKSEESLSKLIQLDKEFPDNLDVLRALGMVLSNNKNFEEAQKVLTRALELSSQDAVILNNLATAYEGLGEIEKAKEFYIRAQSVGQYRTIQINLERLR